MGISSVPKRTFENPSTHTPGDPTEHAGATAWVRYPGGPRPEFPPAQKAAARHLNHFESCPSHPLLRPSAEQCDASLEQLSKANPNLKTLLMTAVTLQKSPSAVAQYFAKLAELCSGGENQKVYDLACAAVGLLRRRASTLNDQRVPEPYIQMSPSPQNVPELLAQKQFDLLRNGATFDLIGTLNGVVPAAKSHDAKYEDSYSGVAVS